jgi:biotin synthase
MRQYGTVSSVSEITTPQSSVFENALAADTPRNTWTKEEIKEVYDTPLMKLAFAAVSQFPNIQSIVDFL